MQGLEFIKEFLKPNLGKIILFLVFFGALFLVPVEYEEMSNYPCLLCVGCPCDQKIILIKTSAGAEFLNYFFSYNSYSSFTIMKRIDIKRNFVGFMLMFGLYILSCSVIFGYNKLKLKK